jgi:hypothetical protein
LKDLKAEKDGNTKRDVSKLEKDLQEIETNINKVDDKFIRDEIDKSTHNRLTHIAAFPLKSRKNRPIFNYFQAIFSISIYNYLIIKSGVLEFYVCSAQGVLAINLL